MMETDTSRGPEPASPQPKVWDPTTDYDRRFQNRNHKAIFGESGYSNYGYWDETTRDATHASDTLVDKLVATFPNTSGTVLDVACGCGGSTQRLCHYFKPEDITAINVSKYQVDCTQARVPASRCLQMDAVKLEFEDAIFDHVLCVEAACCFRSRLRFLKEAHRVLKPGGGLAMTDILMEPPPGTLRVLDQVPDAEEIPLVNRVSAVVYRDMLEVIGFKNVIMTSVLRNTLRAFENYSIGWVSHQWNKGDEPSAQKMMMYGGFLSQFMERGETIKDYIMVSAVK